MNLREALLAAVASLATHKLRSALTMLGILFGVGAVIAMLSIGTGAERQAMALIDSMGLRNVLIHGVEFAEDELREIRKQSLGLSLRDVRAIRESVPHVESVLPRVELDAYKVLSAGGKTKPQIFGVSHDYHQAANLRLSEGRFFSAAEQESHAQVCVIGSKVRQDLFGYEHALGRDLKVNDVWLTVVGVLRRISSTAFPQPTAFGWQLAGRQGWVQEDTHGTSSAREDREDVLHNRERLHETRDLHDCDPARPLPRQVDSSDPTSMGDPNTGN